MADAGARPEQEAQRRYLRNRFISLRYRLRDLQMYPALRDHPERRMQLAVALICVIAWIEDIDYAEDLSLAWKDVDTTAEFCDTMSRLVALDARLREAEAFLERSQRMGQE